MKLSQRMEAVCKLLTGGNILADVGCDHGYVAIAMVEREICPSAIAMDIRPGPLAQAASNIADRGLTDKIETRLSDGVKALQPKEAQSIVIAGMGGDLVVHILSEGKEVCRKAKELILQPQSEIQKVRQYLWQENYEITKEDMVLEEGKYYPMMRVVPVSQKPIKPKPYEMEYGAYLLSQKNPVLLQYLQKEQQTLCRIENNLKAQNQTEAISARLTQVRQKLNQNKEAQMIYADIE